MSNVLLKLALIILSFSFIFSSIEHNIHNAYSQNITKDSAKLKVIVNSYGGFSPSKFIINISHKINNSTSTFDQSFHGSSLGTIVYLEKGTYVIYSGAASFNSLFESKFEGDCVSIDMYNAETTLDDNEMKTCIITNTKIG